MTISYPFVSLDEIKAYLDIPDTVTKLDTRYRLLLATASKQIETATGRVFTRQPITEFFNSRDNRTVDYDLAGSSDYSVSNVLSSGSGLATRTKPQTLYLSGVGIVPEANLTVWYDPYVSSGDAYSESAILTPNTDYQVDFENDAIILYIGTSYRQRALKVSYTAGYAFAGDPPTLSDAIPDTLKLAVMLQAQYLNVKTRADNIGMGTERTVSMKDKVHASPFLANSGLTPEVVGMVRDLKRLRLGTS